MTRKTYITMHCDDCEANRVFVVNETKRTAKCTHCGKEVPR